MAGEKYDLEIGIRLRDNASRAMAGVAGASGDMDRALASATSGARGTAGVLEGPLSRAAESAGRVLEKVTSAIIDFTKRLARYAMYGLAIAGAAITLFARQATMDFASYEQAITNAVTVTGLTGDAFDKARQALTDFGLEVSLQSALMPTEIAEAFYGLGSAGLDVAQTMDAARGVIALGEGQMADMAQTTELALTAMTGFGLGASQMDRIVNVLAATISNSQMRVDRLAVAFPHAAATAYGFGLSLETTSAILGILSNAGLKAEMAGTGLRSVLAKLSDVSKEGEKVLQKYNLRVQQLDVTSHGFLKVLGLLEKAQMSQTDITKLFGIEAANAASILTRTGVPALEAFIRKITGTNRAFEMQAQQLETLLRKWEVFKSTLQGLRIELAERVGPSMTEWLGKIGDEIAGMLKTEEFEDFKEAIGRVLDVILKKAEGIIEVDLPGWLETATNWLQTLTGTEDAVEGWGDTFDRAMIKAELSTLRFVRALMRWATLSAILGILIPGVRGKAGAAAVGGLIGGVKVNRWIADAEKRLSVAEAAATGGARPKSAAEIVAGKGPTGLAEAFPGASKDVLEQMARGWEKGIRAWEEGPEMRSPVEFLLKGLRETELVVPRQVVPSRQPSPAAEQGRLSKWYDQYKLRIEEIYPDWYLRMLRGQPLLQQKDLPAWTDRVLSLPHQWRPLDGDGQSTTMPSATIPGAMGPARLEITVRGDSVSMEAVLSNPENRRHFERGVRNAVRDAAYEPTG